MDEPRKLHPVIWVAAISVTVLSAVGVAALTGILPHGDGQSPAAAKIEPLAAVPAATPPAAAPVVAPPAAAAAAPAAAAPAIAAPPQAVAAPPVAAPPEPIAAPPAAKKPLKPKPLHVAQAKSHNSTDYPPPDAAIPPPGTPYPPQGTPYPHESRAPAPCLDCATVETVRTLQQKAQGSGLGVVAGGLVGGLLGHQVGGGSGRDVATVVGAVAGGFAGNEMEKNRGGSVSYEVVLRMEDGSNRVYKQQNPPPWHPGDRVKVVNGEVLPR